VKGYEAPGDEVQPRLLEAGQEAPYVGRREHLQVRRIVLRLAS
jgi:hypothetical protein